MMKLVPHWALEQQEFWNAIRKRNLWFIKLRYGVVILLLAFIILSISFLKIEFTSIQLTLILIITVSIFIYNLFFHYLRRFVKFDIESFNPMSVSLLQMILDLISLSLLVYYTGGIESPLYMLFVFHMIIGSLILPGAVVYTIASIFVLIFATMITLEHTGVLIHHHVNGLLDFHLYNNLYFVTAYLATFSLMIFVSVHLANGIARQLYNREKDLVDSIKKINMAEKEKQQYIMGIVHEIKTPIAAVTSYLDLILQKFLGPVDEKVEEKLLRAKTRSDEGIQMINDVLNVSKLKLYDQFNEEEIELEKLVCGVIRRRQPFADARLVTIKFIDERKNKDKLIGDRYLLDIAISNLVGNSVKYNSDGGKVEIRAKDINGTVSVEVCDDGIGIARDELPKIFSDFFRASNAKKASTEGSGLGLSVVKKIIERHNGSIIAKSPSRMAKKDQPGSCFTIELPLKREKLNK
ncbi:MAG: HAMP domain-containing histidine kinase [Ignavibacteria bacterium]|nr:HAMP domain-containing histidine kinase [Ignavibacteria bacterium]MBT8383371.1 HAMP domain-containing histidine kinase [Ignavibacteria bacterium]NNJ52747.1 HAMP domain-containing histidine kinase [Ignavibacteriaceae bacterium]NNL21642.1 HAMP domain-containing histidine kinase [Ignavibacteriaceae bacterium]